MRKEEISIYTFEELSEDAKAKAIAWFLSDGPYHGWYEFIGESLSDLGNHLGFDELKLVGFDLPHAVTLKGRAGARDIKSGIEKAKPEFPTIWEDFPELPAVRPCIWLLSEANYTEATFTGGGYYNCRADSNCDHLPNHPNVESELEKLAEWCEDVAQWLLNLSLKWLNDEYDYRMSDEYAIEAIEANEYEFTADGEVWAPNF